MFVKKCAIQKKRTIDLDRSEKKSFFLTRTKKQKIQNILKNHGGFYERTIFSKNIFLKDRLNKIFKKIVLVTEQTILLNKRFYRTIV